MRLLNRFWRSHFAAHPRAYWLERLTDANVPCAPIANVAEVAHNPHLIQREMILHAEHPAFADLIVPGSPFKTAGVGGAPDTRAPQLGEHTTDVLTRLLGYDPAQIADLRSKQII